MLTELAKDDDVRRNPFETYARLRSASPVMQDETSGLWMVFDYDSVRRVLTDHEAFSSRHGPANWMIFLDPPLHTKLRALVARAFTPRSVAMLEPRIRRIAGELLDAAIARGAGVAGAGHCEMDLAADFAVPLPMRVIADMLGVPAGDQDRFVRWNDRILGMSRVIGRSGAGDGGLVQRIFGAFVAATAEMGAYVDEQLERRRAAGAAAPDDLLTRLMSADVDGERLTQDDILGFFQLLLLAGSETTTNLINNAIICLTDHPGQFERLRARPDVLLPRAIEEVLRFRSPLQWMYRVARRDVEMPGGVTIPSGAMVLAMIGSANRDPGAFADPDRFDITRDPNAHLAFGNGQHFCLGAPLARLEARVALTELLSRASDLRRGSQEPWPPREGLHVHGPSHLPVRFSSTRG
jgi:cytochrome P450